MAKSPYRPGTPLSFFNGLRSCDLISTLVRMRDLHDVSAVRDGVSASRTSEPINTLHAHVGLSFARAGVARKRVVFERSVPMLANSSKVVDLAALPAGRSHHDSSDDLVMRNASILVGLRSQVSSVNKNVHNMVESIRGEVANYRDAAPRAVIGHVQLVPVKELLGMESKSSGSAQWDPVGRLAETISCYAQLANPTPDRVAHHLYDRVALLLVDFSPEVGDTPRVYTSIAALIRDGFIDADDAADLGLGANSLRGLTLSGFAADLVRLQATRFPRTPVVYPLASKLAAAS